MNSLGGRGQSAFALWIRTGRVASAGAGIEFKFNPYHDPRNGQFTFAPGGSQSLSRVIISRGRGQRREVWTAAQQQSSAKIDDHLSASEPDPVSTTSEAVYRPGVDQVQLEAVSRGGRGRSGRGSNSAAFQDPMTLEQVFPGLSNSPGGAIIAVSDSIFDFGGPALAATSELAQNWTNQWITQIRALEPSFRYDSFGFPKTLQGQINQLNDLRWIRATAFVREKSELRPLQVETLRFIQRQTDAAYNRGVGLMRAGRLKPSPTPELALGNYIDREVRRELRAHYARYGVNAAGAGPVRVNRRENSASEGGYRRPDARVGAIAYDVTLSPKSLQTRQVRGFFGTDFRPTHVVIVRPSQLGGTYTYVITRPGASQ